MAVEPSTLSRNRLLGALDADELERLGPQLEYLRTERRQVIYQPHVPIEHVYFPFTAVLSVVTQMDQRRAVEVATVGHEGMVGLPVFLQVTAVSAHEGFCQVPGECARMEAAAFTAFVESAPGLHRMLNRYTQALISQIGRNSGCNIVHSVEQRAARWLLSTFDRVDDLEIELSQDFLAQMLGATRPTVNEVARRLQADGLIEYTRGRINIRDRDGLCSRTCDCYGLIAREFEDLLGEGS